MSCAAEIVFDGPLATIRLISHGKVMSLTYSLVADLNRALDAVDTNPEVRCVMLVGTGKTFIVGADIKQISEHSIEENINYNRTLIDLCDRFDTLDLPVIVGINGHAFGGGLELALACTMRVMAAEALVGLPEVKLGILPGAGGVVRLPREVGRSNALSMILTGRNVTAAEALRIGLVQEVVVADDVAGRVRQIAQTIAARAPLAVQTASSVAREIARLPVAEGEQVVQRRLAALLATRDADEGVAAFLAKRAPIFTAS